MKKIFLFISFISLLCLSCKNVEEYDYCSERPTDSQVLEMNDNYVPWWAK